jgi:lipopolysaccharide export system permease protein
VLPEANHRLATLIFDIRKTKPTLTIEPGLFSQEITGYSILARKTFEQSNDLEGVVIYDYTDPTVNVVVTAEKGKVQFTPDYQKLVMELYYGEIHEISQNNLHQYRSLRYVKHRIIMNAEGFDFERSSESSFARGDRELSAQTMQAIVDSLRLQNNESRQRAIQTEFVAAKPASLIWKRPVTPSPTPLTVPAQDHFDPLPATIQRVRNALDVINNEAQYIAYNNQQINKYLVEINKKYSIPLACIVFVFIGAPLGIMARRGTFGIAATLSIGFFLLYWASLIGGEKLADRGLIEPWAGMWSANIVLGILGIYLTLRMGRENPTIQWSRLRRLLPRTFRTQPIEPERDQS